MALSLFRYVAQIGRYQNEIYSINPNGEFDYKSKLHVYHFEQHAVMTG